MSIRRQARRNTSGHDGRATRARPGPGSVFSDADRALFTILREHRSERSVIAARWTSDLAEPGVIYPGLAAAGLWTARRAGWQSVLTPSLVVASGTVARFLVSQAIARSRPPADAWLTQPRGFSLPSRHVTVAALTAGTMARALGVQGTPRRAVPVLAAAGVGASRVCLGVHWPGDVLAGWLFAEGWLRLADYVTGSNAHNLRRSTGGQPACGPGRGSHYLAQRRTVIRDHFSQLCAIGSRGIGPKPGIARENAGLRISARAPYRFTQ